MGTKLECIFYELIPPAFLAIEPQLVVSLLPSASAFNVGTKLSLIFLGQFTTFNPLGEFLHLNGHLQLHFRILNF